MPDAQTRALFNGIDVSNLVGLRRRTFLGVLVNSFARVPTAPRGAAERLL